MAGPEIKPIQDFVLTGPDYRQVLESETMVLVDGAPFPIRLGAALKNGGSSGGGGNPGLEFIFQNGGAALVANQQGDMEVQSDCTITGAAMFADQVGSAIVNIWRCTFNQFDDSTHPTSTDKITGSTPPTISGSIKSKDVALVGWSVQLKKGDVLRFNIDSVLSITRLTVSLSFSVTGGAGTYLTENNISSKGSAFATVSPNGWDLIAGLQGGANVNFTAQSVANLGGGGPGGSPSILVESGVSTKISGMTLAGSALVGDEIPVNRSGANFAVTAAMIAALGGGGSLPAGDVFQYVGYPAAGSTGAAIQGKINAANPFFGDINSDPRAAIQAAYDYCVSNVFQSLYIPCPRLGGGFYNLTGPIFFDPSNNLRNGVNLANQKLGVVSAPSVFAQGKNVICDWHTNFFMNWNSSPCFWIGTNNIQYYENFYVKGPQSTVGLNIAALAPLATAFAVAAGSGGAADSTFMKCGSDGCYNIFSTGQNGQDPLGENNKLIDCYGQAAFCFRTYNSQALVNLVVGGNMAANRTVFQNGGQGILVLGGEFGAAFNPFNSTYTGFAAPSGITGFTDVVPGGTNFTNYTFTIAGLGGAALADGTFIQNSWVVSLPSFGYVPFRQSSYNSGTSTGTFTLDIGWTYMYYGEDTALSATNFATELAAATTIFACQRATVGSGMFTMERSHIESTFCLAMYDTAPLRTNGQNPASGRCVLIDIDSLNWNPGLGDLDTPTAHVNLHFPCIRGLGGDFISYSSNMPSHQGQINTPPIVIQWFDRSNGVCVDRFVVTGSGAGFAKSNLRYVGDCGGLDGNTITRGPGFDNSLTTQPLWPSKAMGFGEWDGPVWVTQGSIPPPPYTPFLSRMCGTMYTKYFGYRPAFGEAPRITTADLTNLTNLSGTIPMLCGGVQHQISQVGTIAATGGPATSNMQGAHTVIDTGGFGFSYYADKNVNWSYNGTSHVVRVAASGDDPQNVFFNGQEIGLDNGTGVIWYIVTGTYLKDGYITVYRESTTASLLAGAVGSPFSGANIVQRKPQLSFPGQVRVARVTATTTINNSTAFVDITGATLPVWPNIKYAFRFRASATAVAGGVNYRMASPAVNFIEYDGWTTDNNTTGGQQRGAAPNDPFGGVTAVTAPVTIAQGTFQPTARGNFKAQATQNTANASNSSVVAGVLELEEIAA